MRWVLRLGVVLLGGRRWVLLSFALPIVRRFSRTRDVLRLGAARWCRAERVLIAFSVDDAGGRARYGNGVSGGGKGLRVGLRS